MNCAEVRARLHAYVDGELTVGEIAAVDGHCEECRECEALARSEREFRRLLRRQPREAAPPELRARILHSVHREARVATSRRWVLVPAVAVATALVVAVLLPWSRQAPPLVAELVDKHIAYAQIERPAELASGDRGEVAEWFRSRAGMRVTVPDYSPSGIQLVGARLADAHEHKAAYLLYEKGRTLLSVFMVPVSGAEGQLRGRVVPYRGHDYLAYEQKGFRTISWTDGQTLYGLVSMLDYQALLECADRLRLERANQTRL
ncbi:MAG: anti-sigma factor family protein [Candidatus Rokuibacteriota bacterium]